MPGRNYDNLYSAIKQCGKWWHYLESTWLIITSETSQQIWTRLVPHLDKSDFILIIEVRNDCHGWLPKDAWDWITENVPY
jgi:hypothetical protein